MQPAYYEDFKEIKKKIWSMLDDAVTNRSSQFRIPVFICGDQSDIDGRMLEVKDVSGKRFTILNFWATWCAPCVEEMPILSEFYNRTKMDGISVIGLAIDNEKNVKEFLLKIKVDHHLLVAGAKGTNIMEKIRLNPSNSLPFTIMFDENYDVLEIKLGKLTLNELLYWVNTAER